MKTKQVNPAVEFFKMIPDEELKRLIKANKGDLEKICIALTLDLQLLEEYNEKNKN